MSAAVLQPVLQWGEKQELYRPHKEGPYIPGKHKLHIPRKPPSIPIPEPTPRQQFLDQEKKRLFAISQLKAAMKGVVANSRPTPGKLQYVAAERINLIDRPIQAVEDFVVRPKTVRYVHPPRPRESIDHNQELPLGAGPLPRISFHASTDSSTSSSSIIAQLVATAREIRKSRKKLESDSDDDRY